MALSQTVNSSKQTNKHSIWLKIPVLVFMLVGASITYGIAQDQITARICLQYFTIGHYYPLAEREPTIIAFYFGIRATFWVGLIFASILSLIAFLPRKNIAPLSIFHLVQPVLILLAVTAGIASIAGLLGYLAASSGQVVLSPYYQEVLTADQKVPFLVDLWIHLAAYTSAGLGGLITCLVMFLKRGQFARQASQPWPRWIKITGWYLIIAGFVGMIAALILAI